ncbi:reverse transcriptase domain-containing protein [Artemisia annua]|uniref:Reverse transcriptase domain-containing protein n=1 Tax=Artemisia annua TaxID=35608 RepID=A0A2U1L158_ARTAN|nr:reverse transcriptase domain-containing protein [Artemisia annua]
MQGRIQISKRQVGNTKGVLSKAVNRSSSVYKVRNEVINNISYQWNKEAETSFQRWKNCMEAVPTVVPPTRGEVLSLHIAASPDEIGAMLFAERRCMQIPIYFISRALPDVEQSYAASEKLILALVHATRRLRRYFKDHPIRVLTDKPFERAFLNPDGTRRMVKWAKELEEYDIEYEENDPFEGQSNEPAKTYESSMSSNKRIFQEEKHHIGDSKTCSVPHNQKKEERLVSGMEQQASTN